MRLVDIGGYYVNPDRVAYLKDATPGDSNPRMTRIGFSGMSDDNVLVAGSVADVAHYLTVLLNPQEYE